ncbi:MAG TPA: hypothetical protein VG184_06145 [Acidimicrobiales bacterium]|jgi:hypothetical protein|nr:hypothetical protein [Acidimicrobiales bacterium]
MSDTPDPAVSHVLGALRAQLGHLEKLVEPELHAAESAERQIGPAWRRATAGENRLPVAAIVTVAIVLQVALPAHLNLGPTGLLPGLEGALLIGLVAANPRHIDRTSTALRVASVTLIAVISVANAWSSWTLVTGLVNGTEGENARRLLTAGASIYLTNIIVFSLWFWEWDRGGPVARARAVRPYPDFLFPQMAQPDLAPRDWTPKYFDYLYTSFTNATAFSPTDTMPLAIWAKMLMLVQSAVALVTIGLVVARAVNILK